MTTLVTHNRNDAIDRQDWGYRSGSRSGCLRSYPNRSAERGDYQSFDHRSSYPATVPWFDHFLPLGGVEDAERGAGAGGPSGTAVDG